MIIIRQWNDLGKFLIPELGKRGISTSDFAEMLGTSRPYLWQVTHIIDFVKPKTERRWMMDFQNALEQFDLKKKVRE